VSVNSECANAISFLITHHHVFEIDEEGKPKVELVDTHVLDGLMVLTGSDSRQVRTRAFSTLSTLSTYASQHTEIMKQIDYDIKLPTNVPSSQYLEFIRERLADDLKNFREQYKSVVSPEKDFAGLYCLL
jgi:hypothetical protein